MKPGDLEILYVRAAERQRVGDFAGAERAFRRLISRQPTHLGALVELGNLQLRKGDPRAAAKLYLRACRAHPRSPIAWYNLGSAHMELSNDSAEAEHALRRAVALEPGFFEAVHNLAIVLRNRRHYAESEALFGDALAQRPDGARVHFNVGLLFRRMGRHERAVAALERAITLDPAYASAHTSLAFELLLNGDYARGWREYEWRLRESRHAGDILDFPVQRWAGEPLGSRTLLLHAERGVGDTVQLARFVPTLAERHPKATIAFETHASLAALMARSFGHLPNVAIVSRSRAGTAKRPAFDLHLPLLSVPHLLGVDVATIPGKIPYLTPGGIRRYGTDEGVKVGVSWYSQSDRTGTSRSLPLRDFVRFGKVPGVELIDLQYGDTAAERARVARETGLTLLHDDAVDAFDDLDAFAEQVAGCDLIISIDNTTVHVAGAIGQPAWVLLPPVSDWRWLMGCTDSPWYPTHRLFRKDAAGDWTPVLDALEERLRGFVAERPARRAAG